MMQHCAHVADYYHAAKRTLYAQGRIVQADQCATLAYVYLVLSQKIFTDA